MNSKQPLATNPRDPLLLSRAFCVGWTSLCIVTSICSVNALLRMARSDLEVDGGIAYGEVSRLETMALATPIIGLLLLAQLYLALLHGRARKLAGLPAGYPPIFCLAWAGSLAAGLGRTLVRFACLFPFLSLYLLTYKTLVAPLHVGKKLLVDCTIQTIWRFDLLRDARCWKGLIFLGQPGAGSITFFPVIQPAIYVGLVATTALIMTRLALSHRGRIAPLADYLRDEGP